MNVCPARPRKRIYSRFWGDSRLILVGFRSTRILELLCPFWGEIKRRKVSQVALVYTVVVDMSGLLGESYSVLGASWRVYESI